MRLLSHLRKWKRQSSWSISSCSCLLFMQLPFLHAAAFSSCSCLLFMQLPSIHAAALLIFSYHCKVPWSPDEFPTVDTQLMLTEVMYRSSTCDWSRAASCYVLFPTRWASLVGFPRDVAWLVKVSSSQICYCWQSQVSISNVIWVNIHEVMEKE